MKKYVHALLLIVKLIISLISFQIVSATATYIFFNVEPIDQEGLIFIEWETNVELDNAGFYVQRSLAETGPYLRLSGYLPSQSPDGINGAYYSFNDDTVQENTVYYYRIESVDIDGTSAFSEIRSTVLESTEVGTPTISVSPEITQVNIPQTPTPESLVNPTPTISIPSSGLPLSGAETPGLNLPNSSIGQNEVIEALPTQSSLFPKTLEEKPLNETAAIDETDVVFVPGVIQPNKPQEKPPALPNFLYVSLVVAWLMLAIILLLIIRRISEV